MSEQPAAYGILVVVRIRGGTYDPSSSDYPKVPDDGLPGGVLPSEQDNPPSQHEWRCPHSHVKLKIIAGLVLAMITAASLGNPTQMTIMGLGTAVLLVLALRDVIVPVRLAADAEGIRVVRGFATLDRVAWADIERIRVDTRIRLSSTSRLVEIDTGETLYLLGASELGAPVDEVVQTLLRMSETHRCA